MDIEKGSLHIVGIGVGGRKNLTHYADEVIRRSNAIVGYKRYVELIRPILTDQDVYMFGMRQEEQRCEKAIELALSGQQVSLVSSGDPGIYGMASLTLELVLKNKIKDKVEIEVVPGLSSLSHAASLVGAPLSNDFAVISLSDLLVPWERIEARIEAAAGADFVIVFYNPKSKKRVTQIEIARNICLRYRDPDTPVGIVRQDGDSSIPTITTLDNMFEHQIDMLTTIIIGNSSSYDSEGTMVTPRGYKL